MKEIIDQVFARVTLRKKREKMNNNDTMHFINVLHYSY